MSLICEVGKTQLVKHGEVTCGDSVEVVRNPDETVVVLSDGLGSGVKANILSNLTTKIISKMVSSKVPLLDIVETIVGTLPVCSVRGVAYSTFTILKISPDGEVDIIDFDGLPPILIRNGMVEVVERETEEIFGKQINSAHLKLNEDDLLFISSDGVTEAGLGLTLPMGLQTKGLVKALKEHVNLKCSAQELVDQIIDICMSYYISEPGDDTTGVAVQMRQARECAILTGLPPNKEDDARIVGDFLRAHGRKAICGGTTAQIFARESGMVLTTDEHDLLTAEVPPISHINGIELVTEGIITMNKCSELLEYILQGNTLSKPRQENGSTLLLNELLLADRITIFFGTQLNPAYEQIKPGIRLRNVVIEKLTSQLQKLGKEVIIHQY